MIDEKLKYLQSLIEKRHPYLKLRSNPSSPALSGQILCRHYDVQVKIEVNTVIMGPLPPVTQSFFYQSVQDKFKKNAQLSWFTTYVNLAAYLCQTMTVLELV